MRKTDPAGAKTHFRTDDRIFRVNEHWFFATREGDSGPYASRQEAEDELTKYLMDMALQYEKAQEKAENDEEASPRDLNSSVWDNRPDVR